MSEIQTVWKWDATELSEIQTIMDLRQKLFGFQTFVWNPDTQWVMQPISSLDFKHFTALYK